MLLDQMWAAIVAAPRSSLRAIGESVWRAWGHGELSEAEAGALQAMIEARAVPEPAVPGDAPPACPRPTVPRKTVGPRRPAETERRRRWAASGWIPARIAARLTTAEAATLAVVAAEAVERGDCRMPLAWIAARAGVSRSSAKAALRLGRTLGLISIEERRVSRYRNRPNIVRIVSAEWRTWLRGRVARPGGGGVRNSPCLSTREIPRGAEGQRNRPRSAEGQSRPPRRDRAGGAARGL